MSSDTFERNTDIHDKVYKSYNLKHQEIYNPIEQARLTQVISDTVKMTGKDPSDIHVLDVGAGTGNLALKYLDLGCNVTASDVSLKSLEELKKLAKDTSRISLNQIVGENLDLPDNTFDIICTYSVFHHIPDYILTLKEMIRVAKPGGLIYIEHEANEQKYSPGAELKMYQAKTKQTAKEHILKLHRTGELYTYDFFKAAFIKTFINKRYQREGDIHVWADDHIEWDLIKSEAEKLNCEIVKEVDYLMYRPKGGEELYQKFADKCSDTKYMIIRK